MTRGNGVVDKQLEQKNDTQSNLTARDAYRRMDAARWGSLRKESRMAYLYTLQAEVAEWLGTINFEIKARLDRGEDD